MLPHTIECDGCGSTRVAREKDGAIVPYHPRCPDCGSTEFTVLSAP